MSRFSVFPTGIVLLVGTRVKFKIIQYLLVSRRCNVGVINVDDIILFEHLINLLNIPVILLQLLRILFPAPIRLVFGNIQMVSVIEIIGSFTLFHRAIGGLGIATVR